MLTFFRPAFKTGDSTVVRLPPKVIIFSLGCLYLYLHPKKSRYVTEFDNCLVNLTTVQR